MKIFALIVCLFGLISLSYAQEDEVIIEELEKQRAEQQAEIKQIEQSTEAIETVKDQAAGLGQKALTMDDLMSEKFQKIIEDNLKNSPLKDMDRDLVRQMLLARVAGRPAEKLFKTFPSTLEIMIDLMKDDKALLGLLKLARKKKEMMNFTAIWIILFLTFWMLKKRIAPKTAPFKRRLIFKTILSLLGSFISFTIFYVMFKDEIGPTVSIIIKNLL